MDAPQKPKRRRRWVQYSLRTFLVAMCIVGCGLGWLADRVNRRNEAIAKVRELSERIVFDSDTESLAPHWLRECLGEDYFARVKAVVIWRDTPVGRDDLACLREFPEMECLFVLENSKFDDEALRHLKYLTRLRVLLLDFTRVGDSGLAHLKELKSLEDLSLYGTQVTDAGLAHIAHLTELRELNLRYTRVGDRGLAHLSSLQKLRKLDLEATNVTARGCRYLQCLASLEYVGLPWRRDDTREMFLASEELRKALPNCSVIPPPWRRGVPRRR